MINIVRSNMVTKFEQEPEIYKIFLIIHFNIYRNAGSVSEVLLLNTKLYEKKITKTGYQGKPLAIKYL